LNCLENAVDARGRRLVVHKIHQLGPLYWLTKKLQQY
jgi:hypothetical protein